MTQTWSELIVRDGDRVRATSQFIVFKDGRAVLCGEQSVALGSSSIDCDEQLSVPVSGLDVTRLANQTSAEGTVRGMATIVGVWRNDRVQVERQSAPHLPAYTQNFNIPCPEPEGGWIQDPLPDLESLRTYIMRRPDQFGPLWVGTASPPSAVARSSGQGLIQAVIVPVVGREPESARPELARHFDGNLCLRSGHKTISELARAQDQLRELMTDKANRVAAVLGGKPDDERIAVRLVVLTDTLDRKLATVGQELIAPSPIITPEP